jgi:hypothetical protein
MILVRNDRVFQLFGINIFFELFKKTAYKCYGWPDSNISIPGFIQYQDVADLLLFSAKYAVCCCVLLYVPEQPRVDNSSADPPLNEGPNAVLCNCSAKRGSQCCSL